MEHRNRNTALVLIAAGAFLLLEHYVSFFTIAALLFLVLGIHRLRSSPDKLGYMLLGTGVLLFFSNFFWFVIAIAFLSLGWFYLQSQKQARGTYQHLRKHNVLESFKRDKEPWELKPMSMWNVVGEIYMDLSLVMLEEKETTVMLQGMFGDVDIIVPEFLGVSISATTFVGQISAGSEKEAGLINKLVWQSPNFETSDQKVKLLISYIVGDIDIKVV